MSDRPPPVFGAPAAPPTAPVFAAPVAEPEQPAPAHDPVVLDVAAAQELEGMAYETAAADHLAVLAAGREEGGWPKAHVIAGRRDAILEVVVALRDPSGYGTTCTVDTAFGLTTDIRKRRPLVPAAKEVTAAQVEFISNEFPHQGTPTDTGIELTDDQHAYWRSFNAQMRRNATILRASASARG